MESAGRLTLIGFSFRMILFLLILFSAIVLGLIIGSTPLSIIEIFNALFGGNVDQTVKQILFEIRLPRVLYAVAVGGGLSIAGAVFQAILMNPLAEPYILGISSGGTFGAILSFVLGLSFIGTQLFSFAGAMCVMLIVFFLGKRFGSLEPNVLLLTGVMVGAFFSAAILLMMGILNDSLRTAVFWLIGNLSLAENDKIIFVLPTTIIIGVVLTSQSYKYNLLSMGSDNARQLGINTSVLKNLTYVLTSIMIGTLVSVSGIIGFVGLLVPHVCRMVFGTDNRIVLPASFFLGASYFFGN